MIPLIVAPPVLLLCMTLLYDLDQAETRLLELAVVDDLTGAYSRRFITQAAERIIARTIRYQEGLGVIMMDVDHFKRVNDSYGHPVGDAVLVQLKLICDQHLRTSDILVRYGGEEFLILLPHTELKMATLIAERLRKAIAERPFRVQELDLPVTVSFGVASLKPDETDVGMETLIQRADKRLYEAKRTGRNRVVAEDPVGVALVAEPFPRD